MNDENFGFSGGPIPSGVSVAGNIEYALAYQSTHTREETILWFKQQVQNKGAWDYKQNWKEYENFGNFNYAAVGTALGMSEDFLRSGAGGAQSVSNGDSGSLAAGVFKDWMTGNLTGNYGSYDNPEDQVQIGLGIDGVKSSMQTPQDTIGFWDGIKAYATQKEYTWFLTLADSLEQGSIAMTDLMNLLASLSGSHSSVDPYDFNLTNSYFFQRCEPLALDTNKDGFIATTSVTESETYFDLTGDGIKERTGWIKGEDALLVYDANEDGQVGGISEVFGNATTEGFDELRDTIDSNYDNKIDRKDILFNRLQLWHDYDQDGSVDVGELKSLKEEGITSIDLNSVQTNIETNGHLISEASHYYNTDGEKELVADIHLAYDARDTIIDLVQEEDFTIDSSTLNLPNLRGYGLVVDSFIAYQTLFTCKTFSIKKALHVKIQNTVKWANDEAMEKVA